MECSNCVSSSVENEYENLWINFVLHCNVIFAVTKMSEETLKAAFDKFDKDGSGEISASELVSVLLELKKSEAEARDLAGVSFPSIIMDSFSDEINMADVDVDRYL